VEVWQENGPPAPDLFKPLCVGPWQQRDGHTRDTEAPPARQVHVVPAIAGLPVIVEQSGDADNEGDPDSRLLLLLHQRRDASWLFFFFIIPMTRRRNAVADGVVGVSVAGNGTMGPGRCERCVRDGWMWPVFFMDKHETRIFVPLMAVHKTSRRPPFLARPPKIVCYVWWLQKATSRVGAETKRPKRCDRTVADSCPLASRLVAIERGHALHSRDNLADVFVT
jgi:hypothetical protein